MATIQEKIAKIMIDAERRGVSCTEIVLAWSDADEKRDLIVYVLERGFAELSRDARFKSQTALKRAEPLTSIAATTLRTERAERAAKIATTIAVARIEGRKRVDAVITAAVVKVAETLFDTWLIDGRLPLGKATGADLIAAAEREEGSAEGHLKNATFYRSLADRLKDGQCVETAFSVSDGEALRAAIYDPVRPPVLIRHMRHDPGKRIAV